MGQQKEQKREELWILEKDQEVKHRLESFLIAAVNIGEREAQTDFTSC